MFGQISRHRLSEIQEMLFIFVMYSIRKRDAEKENFVALMKSKNVDIFFFQKISTNVSKMQKVRINRYFSSFWLWILLWILFFQKVSTVRSFLRLWIFFDFKKYPLFSFLFSRISRCQISVFGGCGYFRGYFLKNESIQ